MAKKNKKSSAKAKSFTAVAATSKSKQEIVQEVYDDELKDAVKTFIQNTVDPPVIIDGKPIVPKEVFLTSLKRIRDTQAEVLQLIEEADNK